MAYIEWTGVRNRDFCGCPTSNHKMWHAELGHEPQSLEWLNWSLFVVERLHRRTRLQQNVQKVANADVFHAVLDERRKTTSKSQRAQLFKSIRQHFRRAVREHKTGLREQRNARIEHLDPLTSPCPRANSSSLCKERWKMPRSGWISNLKKKLHRKLVLNRLVSKLLYGM